MKFVKVRPLYYDGLWKFRDQYELINLRYIKKIRPYANTEHYIIEMIEDTHQDWLHINKEDYETIKNNLEMLT